MSTQVARRQKWFVLFCSLAVVVAAGCAARTPARSFPDLQQRLSPGVTVHVTDSTGTETRGTVIEVSPSGLTLVVDGVPRHMEQEVVSQVQTYGDPLWNGLLVGMAVGTAGALISDPTYAPCPNNAQMQCANSHVGQRVFAIGVMGGVGAGSTRSFGGIVRSTSHPSGRPERHGSQWRLKPGRRRPRSSLHWAYRD